MDLSPYQAGYSADPEVLKSIMAYRQSSQPAQPKGNFISHLLPTIGSIGGATLGTLLNPIGGTIAGGAGGGALGKLLENKLEGVSAGHDVLREGIKGGAFSAIPVAGEAAGEAAPALRDVPVLGKSVFGGAKAAQTAAETASSDAGSQAFDKFAAGREIQGNLDNTRLSNRFGTALRNDSRGISDIVSGPKAGYQAAEIGEFADRNNLYGSAENQWLKQLPKVSDNLDSKVGQVIAKNDNTISADVVKKSITDNVQNFPEYVTGQNQDAIAKMLKENPAMYDQIGNAAGAGDTPKYDAVVSKIHSMVDAAADENGNLDSTALHNLSKSLGEHANFNPNADPNIGKDTYKAGWQAVRGHLTDLNPEASQVIHDQSLAIQLSKAFEDASGSGGRARFGMKGVRLPINVSRPISAGEDFLGRSFQNLGGNPATDRAIDQVIGGVAGTAREQLPGRVAANFIGGAGANQPPPANPQDLQLPDAQTASATPTDFSSPATAAPPTVGGYTSDQFEQAAQKAIAAGDLKSAAQLETFAKTLKSQETADTPQLDATGIQKVTDFQNATDALTKLAGAFPTSGNPANAILDKQPLGIGLPGGGGARDLSAQINVTNAQIAKALGLPSGKQAQAALGMALPQVGDSKATAERKISDVLTAMKNRMQNYLSLQQQYSPKNSSADSALISSLGAIQ